MTLKRANFFVSLLLSGLVVQPSLAQSPFLRADTATDQEIWQSRLDNLSDGLPEKLKTKIGRSFLLTEKQLEQNADGVVYQLAQIYDNEKILTAEEKQELASCHLASENKQTKCNYLATRKHYVSDRIPFMKLTFFSESPLPFATQTWRQRTSELKKGQLQPRKFYSIDPRETKNSHEAFKVLMEKFVLEPEFGCLTHNSLARPSIAWFLHQHFDNPPRPCLTEQPYPIRLKNESAFFLAELKNLREIHLITATPGTSFYSRWGHIGLLLIFCEPNQSTPECLNRPEQHVSFDFHADDGDYPYKEGGQFLLGLWHTMNGTHTAMIKPGRLTTRIRDYGTEKQTLTSYKLNLSKSQQTQLFLSAYESLWHYRGYWRNLDNNCVAHLVDVLKTAIYTDAIQFWEPTMQTPKELVEYYFRREAPELLSPTPIVWR